MTAYAPTQYQAQNPGEVQQFPPEERDKLQEIHELINRLLRELPVTAQARPAVMPILPAVPYAYSLVRFPCG